MDKQATDNTGISSAEARFTAGSGRIVLEALVVRLGSDAQCVLTGGDAHIGAVALARPGTEPHCALLCLPGHREDEIARRMAERLARALNCAVCVSAGIHFDRITREEIDLVEILADMLAGQCLEFLSGKI